MRKSLRKIHRSVNRVIRHVNTYLEKEFNNRYIIKQTQTFIMNDNFGLRYTLLFIDKQDPLNIVSYTTDEAYDTSLRFFTSHLYSYLNDYVIFCERGDNIQNRLTMSYSFYSYYNQFIFKELEKNISLEDNDIENMIKDYIDNIDYSKLLVYHKHIDLSNNLNYIVNKYYMLENIIYTIGNGIIIYKTNSKLPICLFIINDQIYLKYFKEIKNKRTFMETVPYSVKLKTKTLNDFYQKYDKDHLLEAAIILK